jgi:hypothetical protein
MGFEVGLAGAIAAACRPLAWSHSVCQRVEVRRDGEWGQPTSPGDVEIESLQNHKRAGANSSIADRGVGRHRISRSDRVGWGTSSILPLLTS